MAVLWDFQISSRFLFSNLISATERMCKPHFNYIIDTACADAHFRNKTLVVSILAYKISAPSLESKCKPALVYMK